MNVPEEVRTAAYTLMQRHLTEPFADDEERRLVLRQADDSCEILAAWLDAQPAAPEPTERWEPVEEMPCTPCGCGVCGRFIEYRNGALYIEDDGELLSAELPDGHSLCRRVEGTP